MSVEVCCDNCSDYVSPNGRQALYCDSCYDKLRDENKELKEEIDRLQGKIYDLESEKGVI